jgi:hypothetical protein
MDLLLAGASQSNCVANDHIHPVLDENWMVIPSKRAAKLDLIIS